MDTWLRQGIIRPSQSPYASQVVIVQKKSGEIHLCMDYQKLNSITVRDAFPLPRIDKALQAVHSSNWFSSFDLAQGYLQLVMDENDIKKTAFRAGSMGLYEFTRMPFGLSNASSSFSRLMEQCLGDQQFVTLLLYLDDICIFAPTIDKMLDHIELVFDRLKQFNLKIKPKKCQFFDTSILFLGHILLAKGISANPEKVEKVRTWPVPKNIKEVQSFLGLASYYRRFIDKFAEKAQCLHELVGPTSNKHRKARAKREATTVTPTEPRIFEWTMKHREAFDALKEALSTAPILGIHTGDRCFFKWTRCHPIPTGQGWALKRMKLSAEKSVSRAGGKALSIPIGNLVLLRDHPEGRNKIQDNYKNELFVMESQHQDLNVYTIKPLNGKGPMHKVNWQQLFDL